MSNRLSDQLKHIQHDTDTMNICITSTMYACTQFIPMTFGKRF